MTGGADYGDDATVLACVDLVDRAGAKSLEIGFVRDNVPVHLAGWYAQAVYRGLRVMVQEQPSPQAAARAMARRMLRGATCRCGRKVTLHPRAGACLWRLEDARWEPGCDAPPLKLPPSAHGDLSAMARELPPPPHGTGRRHGVGMEIGRNDMT